MALERNVYRALEDVVGPENISENPAQLDTYAFMTFSEWLGGGINFMPRPEAVLLPGSTEEVQAILKACNRYKIASHALGTGHAWLNGSLMESGWIQLDMRRMGRILEVNEKNMYAVVEPYVIWAQLQAEAMKVGLNCLVAASANCSALASNCAYAGMGQGSISMGYGERNVLGVEWVLPTGEILRLGSAGSNAGMFTGDGPGPSMRGIMRGIIGSVGGLGVFTKMGIKLYHWSGPPDFFTRKGHSPNYEVEISNTFKNYYIFFPTWKEFADAQYKLGEAEIASIAVKINPALVAIDVTASNEEMSQALPRLQALAKGWRGMQIVLASDSQREHEYKEKVLDKLLEETNGKKLPLVEDPAEQGGLVSSAFRMSRSERWCFRPTGSFSSILSLVETPDVVIPQMKVAEEVTRGYMDKGLLLDDGGDGSWGVLYQQSDFSHLEYIDFLDPADPESIKALGDAYSETTKAWVERRIGGNIITAGDEEHAESGPACLNYPHWLHRIKKEFDPNMASDGSWYTNIQE